MLTCVQRDVRRVDDLILQARQKRAPLKETREQSNEKVVSI